MRCRYLLARIHHRYGRLEEARTAYEATLDAAERWGFRLLQAEIKQVSSTLYLELGDEARARALIAEAITLYREQDRLDCLPDVFTALAAIERNCGHYYAAAEQLDTAFEQYEALEHTRGMISVLSGLGHLYCLMGDHQRAQDVLNRAQHLCIEKNEPIFLPTIYVHQAFAALGQHDRTAAEAWHKQATTQIEALPQSATGVRSDRLDQWLREIATELGQRTV